MDVSPRLNICIVDDNPRLRAGLRRLLARQPDMAVVAEAESVSEAQEVFRRGAANMYVVDLSLGRDSGFDLIRFLAKSDSDICVVVLSWHNESAYRRKSVELGAHAYVVKSDPPTTLISTLRSVCATRSAAMK